MCSEDILIRCMTNWESTYWSSTSISWIKWNLDFTLPGVLHAIDCWIWGLASVVPEANDVSLACTKFSSSKSPQLSHSFPRSKLTAGNCEDEAVSQLVPWFVTAVDLAEGAELVVFIWFRCCSGFWLQPIVPGFIRTEEPEYRWIFRKAWLHHQMLLHYGLSWIQSELHNISRVLFF